MAVFRHFKKQKKSPKINNSINKKEICGDIDALNLKLAYITSKFHVENGKSPCTEKTANKINQQTCDNQNTHNHKHCDDPFLKTQKHFNNFISQSDIAIIRN